jgi:hypothetical protein
MNEGALIDVLLARALEASTASSESCRIRYEDARPSSRNPSSTDARRAARDRRARARPLLLADLQTAQSLGSQLPKSDKGVMRIY